MRDVLVIGGGIMGLLTARELRKAGRSVALIEKSRPGAGTTWASAGIVSTHGTSGSADIAGVPGLRLRTASFAEWPLLAEAILEESGTDVEYRLTGVLLVALHAEEAQAIQEKARAREWGDAEWMPPDVLRGEEPCLSDALAGALLVAGRKRRGQKAGARPGAGLPAPGRGDHHGPGGGGNHERWRQGHRRFARTQAFTRRPPFSSARASAAAACRGAIPPGAHHPPARADGRPRRPRHRAPARGAHRQRPLSRSQGRRPRHPGRHARVRGRGPEAHRGRSRLAAARGRPHRPLHRLLRHSGDLERLPAHLVGLPAPHRPGRAGGSVFLRRPRAVGHRAGACERAPRRRPLPRRLPPRSTRRHTTRCASPSERGVQENAGGAPLSILMFPPAIPSSVFCSSAACCTHPAASRRFPKNLSCQARRSGRDQPESARSWKGDTGSPPVPTSGRTDRRWPPLPPDSHRAHETTAPARQPFAPSPQHSSHPRGQDFFLLPRLPAFFLRPHQCTRYLRPGPSIDPKRLSHSASPLCRFQSTSQTSETRPPQRKVPLSPPLASDKKARMRRSVCSMLILSGTRYSKASAVNCL